jgi:hypothetical protein
MIQEEPHELCVSNVTVLVLIFASLSWHFLVLLLLWNCKSITSLLWIPKTMYHILGIELHMKQKFTECLTKRHRSTAEYFDVVTQSAVKAEDAERGFQTMSRDFEQVTRPQNKWHDVIDMDWNVSCELYISTRHNIFQRDTIYFNATLERQKRESLWKFEKCFLLKVGRGSTVLTRLPRTISTCEEGLVRQSSLFAQPYITASRMMPGAEGYL